MMSSVDDVRGCIRAMGSEASAKLARRYFKMGSGDYAEGDRFLGVSVPQLRGLLARVRGMSEAEVGEMLRSVWHEERLFALLLMVRNIRGARGDEELRKRWVHLYLSHLAFVNNWDLVDASAAQILGEWLLDKDRSMLDALADSSVLWERRVAVVSTLAFIRKGEVEWAFRLVRRLLADSHDLMHKACGWMLRETYKKQPLAVLDFLEEHHERMPRTMLRYAMERLPPEERKRLLQRYRPSGMRTRLAR